MSSTFYTEEEYDDIQRKYNCVTSALKNIFDSFATEHRVRLSKTNNENNPHYPFITKNSYEVINHFMFLDEHIQNKKEGDYILKKFLDVGCGAGNIVLLAKKIFHWPTNICGIERDRKLSEVTCQFMDFDVEVFNMDAFNFKNYTDFDIIYYYCPIADYELQKKLELLIEKKMKVGAYLIPFLKQDKSFTANGNFKQIDKKYEIYEKMK